MNFETENFEFKSGFTEEIYKEVIAFANTDGGVLYIGIDNDGNAVGLNNVDDEYTRITNGICDAILPDVTMFVKYTIQENKVVRITISEGTNKPYYLRSKGLKPNGVYVRQGTSSVQASSEQIRQMIKNSDGDNFESMRSLEQELTFVSAVAAFESYGVDFSEEKYLALGMIHKTTDCLPIWHCLCQTNASIQSKLLCSAMTKTLLLRIIENSRALYLNKLMKRFVILC